MREWRRWTTPVAIALAAAAIGGGCGDEPRSKPATTTEAQQPSPKPEPEPEPDRDDRRPRPEAPPTGDGKGGVELVELGQFDAPLHLTQPAAGDDEHLYVVEQCGRVQRVPVGGGEAETFLDLGGLVTCGGEQGLLSLAFAPDYQRSGLLYVYYTDAGGAQMIAEYRRAGNSAVADPDSARELLRMEDFASNHNGGLLLFGPGDRLYAGTGDGGGSGDPERTAQDPGSLLGKLLEVDPRSGETQIAALGLRNPWRYSFDRKTGDLWIGDVGQDALEEIDSVPAKVELGPGLNFGWSAFEGTQAFNSDQEAPGARPPTLEYPNDGGCSVTGGYVVRDPELRSLYGRYLYGDFCAGELRSFTAEPGKPAADDVALGLQVSSLSSFGEDADGRLYAVSLEGPVFRLTALNSK